MLRAELKADPSIRDPNDDDETFRMKWLDLKIKHYKKNYVQVTTWKKVDTTKWIYRSYSQLVGFLGGWDDQSAIDGANEGVMECMSMGYPFVRKHPQTKIVMFAIAEMQWAEIYEQAWTETQHLAVRDEDSDHESDDGKDQQKEKNNK